MKILLSLAIALLVAENVFPQTVEFQLDMRIKMKKFQFTAGTDVISITGTFNGWSIGVDRLTDSDGDSVYTITRTFSIGDTLNFKFVKNSDVLELNPARIYVVPAGSSAYFAYFDRDEKYYEPKTIATTFSCNMEYEKNSGRFNPLTDTLSVRGSFNGWSNQDFMSKSTLNPNIYEVKVTSAHGYGERIQYKYAYQNAGSITWENNPDKTYIITRQDYDAGRASVQRTFNNLNRKAIAITFSCDMKYEILSKCFNPSTDTLSIRGTFNGWSDQDIMTRTLTDPDVYEAEIIDTLDVGESLHYKFSFKGMNGITWENDPDKTYTLTLQDYNLGYFSVKRTFDYLNPKAITIKFSCNMKNEIISGRFIPAADKLSVRGSFNNWTADDIMIVNSTNPDIYEAAITDSLGAGELINYKFAYQGPGGTTWENDPDKTYTLTLEDYDLNRGSIQRAFNNITQYIVVNSPNGGENCVSGNSHLITWTSSNIDNVKIDYSTNNGANWINIITSTPNIGTYLWDIPDTPSDLCKILISDVSNPSIKDTSNNVFSIIEYPSLFAISYNYSFGDPKETDSYKIIGLPGQNDLAISSIISGKPGKEGDWRAFWDPGSGSYIEYDGTNTFTFTPGSAFWIISKNEININKIVNSVSLSDENLYSIPVHSGWNLISNPFDKNISWSSVQTINSVSQPVHFYQNGSYTNPSLFEPYKGYYFYNINLTSLKIPYSFLSKENIINPRELKIRLVQDGKPLSVISAGFCSDAGKGIDNFDIFSPPSNFCKAFLTLFNNEIESEYKYLQKEYRPEPKDGEEFGFIAKNTSTRALELLFSGLENLVDYGVFLLDKDRMKLYDLKMQNSFELKSSTAEKRYSLFIGTEEYINIKKQELLPDEYKLYQNYPNPFNPLTNINYSLPGQMLVSIKIFDALGRKIETLVNEEKPAGNYELIWNAANHPSGVYFYQLRTENFVETKKMILLK